MNDDCCHRMLGDSATDERSQSTYSLQQLHPNAGARNESNINLCHAFSYNH